MDTLNTVFGRITHTGTVAVLDRESGEAVTRLDVRNVYPVGSDLSTLYEHADGIEITREDAERIGLVVED